MLFFLIAMRMFGFIFLNPILGRRNIPAIAKTGLALVLAVLIYTTQSAAMQDFSVDSSLEFAVLLLKEFAVGYLLGFLLELLDMVFTFAGTLIDFQMGISMAQVYDPQNGAQIALSGKILQSSCCLTARSRSRRMPRSWQSIFFMIVSFWQSKYRFL